MQNHFMFSYWEKNYWFAKYDYAIIGAGIVGLTTALRIKEKNPQSKVAVFDRGLLPLGASTKNAGFGCFATAGELLADLSGISEEEVLATVALRWKGLQLLKSLLPLDAIDYRPIGGTELFRDIESFERVQACQVELNKLLYEATGHKEVIKVKRQELSSQLCNHSLYNPYEGSLNPVKLVSTLIAKLKANGVAINLGYDLDSYTKGPQGLELSFRQKTPRICADTLLFTTNAFTKVFFPDLDIVPVRNQVFVTQPIPQIKLDSTYHLDSGYIYFRKVDNRLLIGGARHIDTENETTDAFGKNQKIINYLKAFAEHELQLGAITIDTTWSGIIATGLSKKPIIEQVDEDVFTACRLGGMGVAIGSAVAQALVDKVLK